jgi:plasmid maintenance system killer protein
VGLYELSKISCEVDVEFQNQELENYFTGNYIGKQKFSEIILQAFRRKINFMETALNFNELSKIRSLNIEKYENHWSARINDQYRIEFDFKKPNSILIEKITKHYEK